MVRSASKPIFCSFGRELLEAADAEQFFSSSCYASGFATKRCTDLTLLEQPLRNKFPV